MAKKKKKENWSGEVRWIKISTNIFDDEKIKLIEKMPEGDTLLVIWFKLLVRAGLVNNNGLIYLNENIPYTDEMLSIVFDKPLPTIRLALRTFQQFGMIDISDTHTILLLNWEKYQNKDGLEKVREQGRKRQQKFREKQAQILLGTSQKDEVQIDSNVTSNVTVTECNGTEVEVEVEKEIEVDNTNISSCSSRSINAENAPTTTPNIVLNDDQKLYGEFGNVCLSTHEYQKLLKRIVDWFNNHNQKKYAVLFLFGINSGLRVSDLLGFDVGDVYHQNFVVLREQKTGKYKKFPLKQDVQDVLNNFCKSRDHDEPLFMGRCGARLDRSQVYRFLCQACDELGIEANVGTHTMRKTFGYHHYKQFKDVALLQAIFNHSSPEVTKRYIGITQDEITNSYLHLNLETSSEDLKTLKDSLKGRTKIKKIIGYVRGYIKSGGTRHYEFATDILDIAGVA